MRRRWIVEAVVAAYFGIAAIGAAARGAAFTAAFCGAMAGAFGTMAVLWVRPKGAA